jgi:hypothetical protein
MFRNRSTRALASLGLTFILALTAMAGPAVILGAKATVITSAIAVPGSVSPGANVAFDISFMLAPTETSTLSQLYLRAETPNGATLLGLEPDSLSQGTCNITDALLTCSFGAVSPGVEVILRAVYKTSGTAGTMAVAFNFNTTGVAKDKGGNSHGDAYQALPGTVDLNGSGNFAGAYIRDGSSALTVFDNQTLHSTRNPQSTLVNAPEDAIGVTVGEATFACPASIGTCFGQWSVISVNGGAPYPNGFSVVLGYKGNIGNASFVHTDDLGNIIETIVYPTDLCSDSSPVPAELPCMIPSSSGGNSFVTLWLTQNGRLSGY